MEASQGGSFWKVHHKTARRGVEHTCINRQTFVGGRLGSNLSFLLLTGVSTTMRQVNISCVLLSENLLLRLKPVIKGTLADASFVDLTSSCGEPFVERGRLGRFGRLWRVVFDVVGCFRLIGFFDVTSSFPSPLPRIRSVTARLGRPW